MNDGEPAVEETAAAGGSRARFVAFGILLSRASGLIRTVVQGAVLGTGPHADVLAVAMRLPNALQNLLGDQAMSAAFIPVYSRFLAEGERQKAARFAGALLGLLTIVVTVAVVLGVWFTPELASVLNRGFLDDAEAIAEGRAAVDRFPRLVDAARVIFPMAGLLVLAAWAQAVLNSHRRFFLAYVAPVLWNGAIIAALGWALMAIGDRDGVASNDRVVMAACFGALIGGGLQLLVQLPTVWRLLGGLDPRPSLGVPGMQRALRAFGPALAGRGVVQLSLWIDMLLATFLAAGAASSLGYAGLLYALPLSVFAMSVAASELPELSRQKGRGAARAIAERIDRGLRQAAFVVVPASIGYLSFGWLVVGVVYRRGRFDAESQWLTYLVLSAYSLGLLASMTSRLLQNTFFALGDTKTPARIAVVRLVVAAGVGWTAMQVLDRVALARITGAEAVRAPLYLGAVGLALGTTTAAWIELGLLRRALHRALPEARMPVPAILRRLLVTVATALPAGGIWWAVRGMALHWQAAIVLGGWVALYLALARWRREPELALWLGRVGR